MSQSTAGYANPMPSRMGFLDAVSSVFRNYATFTGRARRAEYWWFVLFYMLATFAVAAVDGMVFGRATVDPDAGSVSFSGGLLTVVWYVATLLPTLAVAVRRMHDIGRSFWWLFIALVPIVGGIVFLVFACTPGEQGPNRFGPDPIAG